MKITETKYQNIKIIYNPAIENIKIGDFIKFKKDENALIGQVSKINSSTLDDDFNTAELTFVLAQKYNTIKPWRGENLPINAKCELLNEDYIAAMFPFDLNERLLNFGSFLQFENRSMDLPYKKFKTPAYVGYDRIQDSEKLLNMFAFNFDSLNEKFVIFDFKGTIQIPGAHRILAGEELKLPFNDFTLSEVGPKLLEGLSTDCKIVVEDVLQELASYTKENKYHYVPISSLISAVDEMYKTYRLNPLMMFKNKLAKFEKNNIFANQPREVFALYNALKSHNVVIVDFSYISAEWHKEFISNILQMNKKEKASFYLYLALDEYNSDNKILNKLLFKTLSNGIKPILASNYRYISFENIYEFSKNVFLFKIRTPFTRKQDLYEITQALPDESFVINGTLTDGLILCSTLGQYEEKIFIQKNKTYDEEDSEDYVITNNVSIPLYDQKENTVKNVGAMELQNAMKHPNLQSVGSQEKLINDDILNESLKISEEPSIQKMVQDTPQLLNSAIIQNDTNEQVQDIQLNEPAQQDSQTIELEPDITDQSNTQDKETEQTQSVSDTEVINTEPEIINSQEISIEPQIINEPQEQKEPEIIEIQQQNTFNELDVINSLPEDFSEPVEEIASVDDLENIDDIGNIENINNIENTNNITNAPNNENIIPTQEQRNVELSPISNDEELDMDEELLDLLNETEVQEEETLEDFLEQVETLDSQEPVTQEDNAETKQETPEKASIPVYDTNYNAVTSSGISLAEGDMVKHKKYGVGVVKKLIPHQDKFLCSISFDAGFRRLLDPEVSDLEKIS